VTTYSASSNRVFKSAFYLGLKSSEFVDYGAIAAVATNLNSDTPNGSLRGRASSILFTVVETRDSAFRYNRRFSRRYEADNSCVRVCNVQ
jgi:hypothetical protein